MDRSLASAVRLTRRDMLRLTAIGAALHLSDAVLPRAPGPVWAAPGPALPRNDRPRLQPVDTDELDEIVRQAMTAIGVPGVAIGIIAGDWVYTKGFGVTN